MARDFGPKPGEVPADEVARIKVEDSLKAQAEMGLPPELAQFSPGAEWLIEHGGGIQGHIEGDEIVTNKHSPR